MIAAEANDGSASQGTDALSQQAEQSPPVNFELSWNPGGDYGPRGFHAVYLNGQRLLAIMAGEVEDVKARTDRPLVDHLMTDEDREDYEYLSGEPAVDDPPNQRINLPGILYVSERTLVQHAEIARRTHRPDDPIIPELMGIGEYYARHFHNKTPGEAFVTGYFVGAMAVAKGIIEPGAIDTAPPFIEIDVINDGSVATQEPTEAQISAIKQAHRLLSPDNTPDLTDDDARSILSRLPLSSEDRLRILDKLGEKLGTQPSESSQS
ncbi:MAG TPA: hypothetical protein VMR34_03000 [Candidatus Saccharimonadales bacterium]|nr:hypothetical protein [Candidatus Saccharimonadales bacterium]